MKKVNPNKLYPASVLLEVLHEMLTHSIQVQEECSEFIEKSFSKIPGKLINEHIEELLHKKRICEANKKPSEYHFSRQVCLYTQIIHEIESGIREPWK